MKKSFRHFQKTGQDLQRELKDKTSAYVLAAFGFVAGLAWNDAMVSFIDYFFPAEKDTLLAKFLYAVFVTLIVVVIGFYVGQKKKSKKSS